MDLVANGSEGYLNRVTLPLASPDRFGVAVGISGARQRKTKPVNCRPILGLQPVA